MTNQQIIFEAQQELFKAGKISGTGRIIEFTTPDDTIIEVPETEPIHTFLTWKEMGYKVKKGEKAIARFCIWKYTKDKKKGVQIDKDDDEEKGHCFLKDSCFFSASQVERATD